MDDQLYELLQRGYWHTTSTKGWAAIRATGAIKPNIDCRFEPWYRYQTERCYGFLHNCVCLFDFATPTRSEVELEWKYQAHTYFTLKARVALQIRRECLEALIVPNSAGHSGAKFYGHIKHVEVWYPQDIPLAAVEQVYVHDVNRSFQGEFNPIPVGFHDYVAPYQPPQGSA